MTGDDACPASPCVGACTLDRASGLCTGCLRHRDEIAAWPGAGVEVRRRILARVQARRGTRRTGQSLACDDQPD